MPALVLKKMVMGNFDKGPVDPSICDSIDFLVEKVNFHGFIYFCTTFNGLMENKMFVEKNYLNSKLKLNFCKIYL